MELIGRGEDLPYKHRVGIIIKLVRAVSSFHEAGITIHSLNPSRVFIDTRDGNIQIQIYDLKRATFSI